jgi:hypothetical protein
VPACTFGEARVEHALREALIELLGLDDRFVRRES